MSIKQGAAAAKRLSMEWRGICALERGALADLSAGTAI
jgi:hypothetical protein